MKCEKLNYVIIPCHINQAKKLPCFHVSIPFAPIAQSINE